MNVETVDVIETIPTFEQSRIKQRKKQLKNRNNPISALKFDSTIHYNLMDETRRQYNER